ncbi:ankyrin repeat domain-containing protein 50 isoform X1 [Fundulus heteroclitus]|uniref:ankyrin repeat domain-containing protein 50 isoform X1 n=1 Tax=Fundulus heteroclitus TaxID=8078 RepID=UPI00165C1DDB|nr:ankyrin repeat domain-containing protein 50 isoform X1 [Fundulus heteroclitus]XP_012723982.2 ankyrin repeat domain-containing protein 50 isoform X1 [Fundulus heteroclitus]XP_021175150.2 ankyrin repeat domain-containing protein 50 isoform X1 [Fundulus heteroclitus]XP_021175151.2 ankyrin repeat domain-containing protein 50 isoform X1 [Fundulus heteroclitus]XP_035994905.1 ankyrin repeat domain-containing protein 50 isoform X1 [Fundulus heteroclitus]XP_035994906.1 ankyrin repeat domain-containi
MSEAREQMSGSAHGCSSSLLRGRRFYCREWALDKLRRCLDARPASGQAPGLLVTGGPGAGKTALCTELVWPTSQAGLAAGLWQRCLASHFCLREDQRSTVLWRFVLGLVEQLRASPLLPPGYEEILKSPSVSSALEPLNCQKDPEATFKRAVLEPLLNLPPPAQTLMVVVDALDVHWMPGGRVDKSGSIAELLSTNRHLLPNWLLLVCSIRRNNKDVCKMFSSFRRLCLDDLRKPPTVRDVQQYILCRLDEDSALRRQLTPDTADMLNLLHIKSGGCFLFLERVLDGVAAGLVGLREIRDIPGTLNGLYLWLCQRLFPRRLFVFVRPLLNVLLAAPTPLTTQQLFTAAWTQDTTLSSQDFQSKLRTLSPLLIDGPESTKLLFHASFTEWLTDVKYCTQKYLCNRTEGHSMLAMSLTLQGPHLDPEGTCQLATHLVCSGHHKENPSLLALWMLWTGLPPLTYNCRETLSKSLAQLPPLVSQEVPQLLMKSGLLSPGCFSNKDDTAAMHRTAEQGDTLHMLEMEVSIKKLLESGRSVNQPECSGQTLLAKAAHEGSANVAKCLLAHEADPLISDHHGQTPLTLASRQGHVKVLSVLLEWTKSQSKETAVAMMEHVDNEGWTALRSAAWGGHCEAVRLLLDAGADVNGCDSEGRTALRAAAWGGHEEIILTLLDYGANINKADSRGQTPLIAAAYMGHHETVEILLNHNAEVDLADGDGRTALSVAALCVPTAAAIKGYGAVASLLLERGADPGHRDNDGMTPLLLAAYEGNEDVVELLLEAGADVDESAGPDGSISAAAAVTPLLASAAMGHMKTVSRLLFWGADVDAIDCEGRTALCLAAARGSLEVVRALLDRGLDENHKDDLGWTPLHAAACEGHRAVCAALTDQGSMARVGEMDIEGRTPLILAAQEGHLSTVKLLLDRRSPIDHRAYDGHSALSAAFLEGHTEVAELLMKRGADTDVRDAEGRPLLYLLVLEGRLNMATLVIEKGGVPLESRDPEGRTALHVASWQGCVEIVDLLLKHGANPNAQDTEGRPPVHSVAWTGHRKVGHRLLAANSVNIDLACHQGATALSIAAQEGHVDIVKMLLEKGANPNHIDKYGRSPVKVAGKHGHVTIVQLLENYGAKPYLGPLPISSTVSPSKPNKILSLLESNVVEVTAATTSSSLSSPGSTGERFHSMQSSQTSSTCHSFATVQTVPADSLSFIQQIQQHSLPRSRSRHSTLPPPGSSVIGSLHGSSQRPPKCIPSPTVCTVRAMVHNYEPPQKGLSSGLEYHDNKNNKQSSNMIKAERVAGGKWKSVMASLGIMPSQDSPLSAKNREIPSLDYPYRLQSPSQVEAWDSLTQNILSPVCYSFTPTPPCSALTDDLMVTTDPHLNLKQAIKLQFEGPTSAALHKRETPL